MSKASIALLIFLLLALFFVFLPSDHSLAPFRFEGEIPCAEGNFLGLKHKETEKFRNFCLWRCSKLAAHSCHRRGTLNPFPECPEIQSFGFTCQPNCCFWARCYNLFGPTHQGPFKEIVWRRAARKRWKKSCSPIRRLGWYPTMEDEWEAQDSLAFLPEWTEQF